MVTCQLNISVIISVTHYTMLILVRRKMFISALSCQTDVVNVYSRQGLKGQQFTINKKKMSNLRGILVNNATLSG